MAEHSNKSAMGSVEEIEKGSSAPAAPKKSFGAKVLTHYKKWWWAHLLFLIASVLIITLCVVYVGYPNMAQDDINKSTLAVTSLVLSNPTAQSFHLFQNSTVGNKSKYHPQLDAFNASLSLDGGNPFAYVQIPAIHATRSVPSIVDQDVQISNAAGFVQYNGAVLSSEEIKIRVKGRVGLKQGSLPKTTVDYNKVVTLKGFNKLDGFNVTTFSIKLPAEADGTNMVGEISIPNPSVITISMGNVTFDNYLPATDSTPRTFIGTSMLNNLTLVPGDNKVSMRSTINQTLVLGAVTKTYKDGVLPVEIQGNSSVYNGQHLPYFEKPLQMLNQKVNLNVLAALKDSNLDPKVLAGLLSGGGGGSGA